MRFLNPKNGENAAVLYQSEVLTWKQVMADALDLAKKLPNATYILNACENRYQFFVGFLASLLNNSITLLPPNQLPTTLIKLRREYENLVCLSDNEFLCEDIPLINVKYSGSLEQTNYTQKIAPQPEQPVVISFTSGTTGAPKPHQKTWRSLVTIAKQTGERLALGDTKELVTVVATVPPQHMFGLEASVMLPWQMGYLLDASVPFYPNDVIERMKIATGIKITVSTPTHLQILANSNRSPLHVDYFITATSPLSLALAQKIEKEFDASVFEIYGSTETGTLATRWRIQANYWQTLPAIKLQQRDKKIMVNADYFPEPILLPDQLQLSTDQQFEFFGRHNDIIKIAGKRASLTALNEILLSIPGVKDGIFYQPKTTDNKPNRLTAFVVAPGIELKQIRQELRQKIEAIFLPRPLIPVDNLPRNKVGKIPLYSLEQLSLAHKKPIANAANTLHG